MCKTEHILSFLFSFLLIACSASQDEKTMKEMVKRLVPEHAEVFRFEQLAVDGQDRYEIEAIKGKVVIRGNNANSMAVGLNYYLSQYCLTTVSWYADDKVETPDVLPLPSEKITSSARCKQRFFLNYCTFGYSMPWWKWRDWERLIDWMALNGVNLPLAITGQESVWYKVWSDMGLTDEEIRNYFTGPAHLPWHRMTNLDYWQGPLPKEWLESQVELQKRIVDRERQFNMRPVLPAFGGHVPSELKRIFPDAKINRMSSWGGFEDKYRSHFLDPMDSLYVVIQKKFLEEQTRLFGTDHIYGVDPFNEVAPPSWEPEFLKTCSKRIYESLTAVDPDATWLQMTWLFYIDRHLWTDERIKEYLKAVPYDKSLLLDYYCENTEVWKQTESYFGQPYLWCYLGNFGGNTMLSGNLKVVSERLENVFSNGGENFYGIGATLEALDVNPFMYEYVLGKAWDKQVADTLWLEQLADRRTGQVSEEARQAWRLLCDSIYATPASLGQGTLTNARPTLIGSGNWTTNPGINYSNGILFRVWQKMLQVPDNLRSTYEYDIVNIGRQVLGNHFLLLRDEFTLAYKKKDIASLKQKGTEMKELLADLELLLQTQRSFLLGKWIQDARELGLNEADKAYYEENARTLLSTWGDKSQSLNDYANRTWAGLVKGYYTPRWHLFIDRVTEASLAGQQFDENQYYQEVTQFEIDWTKQNETYSPEPVGQSLEIASSLMNKYKGRITK